MQELIDVGFKGSVRTGVRSNWLRWPSITLQCYILKNLCSFCPKSKLHTPNHTIATIVYHTFGPTCCLSVKSVEEGSTRAEPTLTVCLRHLLCP